MRQVTSASVRVSLPLVGLRAGRRQNRSGGAICGDEGHESYARMAGTELRHGQLATPAMRLSAYPPCSRWHHAPQTTPPLWCKCPLAADPQSAAGGRNLLSHRPRRPPTDSPPHPPEWGGLPGAPAPSQAPRIPSLASSSRGRGPGGMFPHPEALRDRARFLPSRDWSGARYRPCPSTATPLRLAPD